ncbi:MAG: HAD hydrolase family protein [Myxococcota bacterium]
MLDLEPGLAHGVSVSWDGGSMKVWALIPTRQASLDLLASVGGHPLIAHSIRRAQEVDRVIVSTVDAAVAAVARQYGAEVVTAFSTLDASPDVVVHVDPDMPFRPEGVFTAALERLSSDDADRVLTVVPSAGRVRTSEGEVLEGGARVESGSFRMERVEGGSGRTSFIELHPLDAIRLHQMDDLHALYPVRGVRFAEPGFADLDLVAFDFDGVMTDDTVIVREDGLEAVTANRGDGMGILRLKQAGVRAVVISKEKNVVVAARCRKLDIPCHHGIDDKLTLFKDLAAKENVRQERIAFVGNDVNDIECIQWAGVGIAVANSRPEVLAVADWVTAAKGGHGAVREVCERVIAAKG